MPNPKETPLGQPAGADTAPSSVELPVNKSIFGKIWSIPVVKELILFVATAAGLQLAVGLGQLVLELDQTTTWNDLFVTVTSWGEASSFALVVTVFRQSVAFLGARLAGTKL